MRRFYIAGAAVFAVLAFSVAVTSSAFGLTSQLLRSGSVFSSEYLISGEGEFTWEESISKPRIDCKTTQAENDINVLSATDLDVLFPLELLECLALNLASAPCIVVFDGLKATPEEYWLITIELSGVNFRGKISKGGEAFATPGLNLSCEAIGIKFAALCEMKLAVGGAEDYTVGLSNLEGGAIDVLFEKGEVGKCSTGGEGFVEGLITVLDAEGLALALSEA